MDSKGLSSFLLGLGVGIGIGILFAPKSGKETRQLIKDKTDEGAEFLRQRSTEIKKSASEWVDRGKEAISRQRETLADAVEAGRQAYREHTAPAPPEAAAE
jgi:gas vesicle protein